MSYVVLTTNRFDKAFKKLDSHTQKIIKGWITKNLIDCADPRSRGKGLTATRGHPWAYLCAEHSEPLTKTIPRQ
ncbi:type II toxin-antitoxin system RelE family toxin [Trueperella pyogenes]|uniref:type II toxin-antitoxin system RelE family toxin n=1 Tax=Trueperella pyogenes TaxID=1661 RepID=UPI003DA8BAEF